MEDRNRKERIPREAEPEDIIYGRNSVLEALKTENTINRIIALKGEETGSLRAIIAQAKEKGIVCNFQDRKNLDRICGGKNHQGVIAYIASAPYVQPEDILRRAEEAGEPPFVLILDEIQDPHNLGAIIRTADAVGAHGVILPKRRACALTGAVAKTSAGALAHVPVARVTNLSATIDYLKEKGLWIAGTDLTGTVDFYDADFRGPIGLVIGSEGNGMGSKIASQCDFIVSIPMHGKITSLNASVAAGVVMYEIFRQHMSGKTGVKA